MSQIIRSVGAGGAGNLDTLSGTAGGIITPSLINNIILSSGSNINTTGNPATHTITFDLANSPTVSGTVTALTLRTSAPTAYTTITGTALTATGTDANVSFGITTKGTGNFNITTNDGGGIIFDGITTGYLSSQWRTTQHAVQTTDASFTNILVIPLTNSLMVSVKMLINGFQSDYSDTVAGEILITAFRAAAGDITLVGNPVINVNFSNPLDTSDIDYDIDVASQSLWIQVVGVVGQTWNWAGTATYMYTISNA